MSYIINFEIASNAKQSYLIRQRQFVNADIGEVWRDEIGQFDGMVSALTKWITNECQ